MKKALCILLAIGMLILNTVGVSAQEIRSNSYAVYPKITSLQEYTDAEKDLLTSNTVLPSIFLSSRGSDVNLSVSLGAEEISFTGKLFTSVPVATLAKENITTYNSGLLFGDFPATKMYNVTTLRVYAGSASENSNVYIEIENIITGKLLEITGEISQSDYRQLFMTAAENTQAFLVDVPLDKRKDKLADKIVGLMKAEQNYLNSSNISAVASSSTSQTRASNYTYSTRSGSNGISATKTTLRNLFNGLSASGTYDCSNSSSIRSILSQTGWKAHTSKANGLFYVMYGVANGSTENLVQITYGEIQRAYPENNNIAAEFNIVGSVILSYNTVLQTANVVMHDCGHKLTNGQFYLVLSPSCSAHLTEARRLYTFESSNTSRNPIGWVLKTVYSSLEIAFSLFQRPSTYQSDTTHFYEDSVGAADNIAGSSYMWGVGGRMGLSADYSGTLASSQYNYNFTFVCKPSI